MVHSLVMNVPFKVPEPIASKRYKAHFRGVSEEDKGGFKYCEVILPISVGQKYHEGGEFEATIKLINKSFKQCTILIADTLRRHSPDIITLANNSKEIITLAKRRGDEWLIRNAKYVEMLSIPYKISKWDEWLTHTEYETYYNLVRELYDSDADYKNIVHETVYEFLLRGVRTNDAIDFNHCVSYVLEESAVTCLWAKSGFKFDVYPNGDNKAMIGAYERLLKIKGYKYRSLQLNIKKFKL